MEQTLKSSKTFRYFTQGNPEKAKYLFYVLHGYEQLAQKFIQKFNHLTEDYFVVAPEGMHRFYLHGTSGNVGASWMTKEARLHDIIDTQNWLNSLHKKIKSKYHFEKEIVLGFSQGGATAARWNVDNNITNQIYWACVFPPDIDISEAFSTTHQSKKYFVLGNHDEYFNYEQQKIAFEFYQKNNFKTIEFEGKHRINNSTLEEILKDINVLP